MRQWSLYSGGRLFAVASRPVCLFLANNYLAVGAAQDLAVAFLASTLALVAVAADSHRRLYLRYFNHGERIEGLSFYPFVASLLLLGGLGVLISMGVGLYFAKSM